MKADIVSVRVLLVTPAPTLRGLLRQGAGQASVPAEVMEADGAAAAEPLLAQGSDLLLLDSGMPEGEKAAICKAARAAKERPFIIAVGKDGGGTGVELDGSVRKPSTAEEAQAIVDACIRSRRPTRILIVDDSSTTRSIVRKILSASKFPLEIADSPDGLKALQDVRERNVDIVLLDFNMPGFDGFEILSELRRLESRVAVVIMTATDDPGLAERAQMAGAAAFLKKPFFPADVDAVLYRLYNLDPPARRA
jgi:DNA-binding response OmpR family regulator